MKRAVSYANSRMISKYDLNKNGLSKAEINKMSLTGKLAVDFAKALKAAAGEMNVAARFDNFYDLRTTLKTDQRTVYTQPSQVPANVAKMIVQATQQAESYRGAKTLAQCFALVDMNEFVVRHLRDPKTNERVISIDYGAGDSTYGAVFSLQGKKLAGIHDGEIVAA